MPDAIEEFFDGLAQRGHERLLELVTGTVRFDISRDGQTDHWRLTIEHGDIAVSRESAETAECVVLADRATWNRIASGELNLFAGLLRGTVVVKGRTELIVLIQGLFPAHPRVPQSGLTSGR
ncbi:SCP2 sterol-binding domain-containing protein [Micromonospora sp. NPDC005806]|uniref:SCP2 sterol-binding domain-containing protein n=1 Tax=Micromonospora sp. NPDC005806 TaxID=3364234 RepID=UPI0036A7DC0D